MKQTFAPPPTRLSKMGVSGTCGVRWNLRADLKKAIGCQSATQPVTISGTIPDDLIIIGGDDFSVNGQTVTATVTAQEINNGTVTLILSVIPKWCKYTAPVNPVQINLKASTAGMALSSTTQPNICTPNPNTNNLSVNLQWEFTPVPKCPDVSIVVQGCQRVSFGEVATPIPGNLYTWDFGDGTSSQQNSVTHYYIQPGTYTVTCTVYNTCSGVPQTAILERTVTVTACGGDFDCPCVGANTVHIDASLGALNISQIGFPSDVINLAQHGNCIAIKGQVIIDQNVSFTGPLGGPLPEMKMQPCSRIGVPSKRQLSLGLLNIHGCASPLPMWQGINVEQHGRISAIFNRIADAEFALTLNPSDAPGVNLQATSAIIIGNLFARNHVGVYLPGYNTGHLVSLPWPFIYNTFDGDGRLNSPCNPNLPNYDMKYGYFGVAALNADFTIGTSKDVGYTNHFLNLRNGVIGQDCRINVYNADFYNIEYNASDEPLFESGSQGIAISAISPFLKPSSIASQIKNCFIETCSLGIFSKQHAVNIRNNTMDLVNEGIKARQPISLAAQDNQIGFMSNGIQLEDIFPLYPFSAKYWIDDNHLNTIPVQVDADGAAIKVDFVNGSKLPPSAFHIIGNVISLSTTTNGITLSGTKNCIVQGNGINSVSNTAGIFLTNAHSNNVSNNTVSDNLGVDLIPPGLGISTGLYIAGSTGNTFCCNILNGSETGTQFLGSCLGTDFRHNEFTRHLRSIVEYKGSRSGPQIDHFNLFHPTSGEAIHDGLFLEKQDSRFEVYGNNGVRSTPCWPEILHTTDWFSESQSSNQSEFPCNSDPICLQDQGPFPYVVDETDRRTAQGVFYGGLYGDALQWEGERYLYAKIKQDSTLFGQDNDVDTFYNNARNGSVGAFYEAEHQIEAIHDLPAMWTAELYILDSLLQRNDVLAKAHLNLLAQATTYADSAAIYMNADSMRLSVDSLQGVLIAKATQADSLRHVKVADLLPILAALPSETLLEANRKTVLQVWAALEAVDSFQLSASQFALIAPIAHQCPLEGGHAVYMARALYHRSESELFRDDSICGITIPRISPAQKKAASEQAFTLMPNPTDGQIYIALKDTSNDTKALFRLTNATGRIVWEEALKLNDHQAVVNASQLSNGLYFCTITADGEVLPATKIIIQH